MKKTWSILLACTAIFIAQYISAQDVEIETTALTDMTFYKDIDVPAGHLKEVWWNTRLANHIYWDDVTEYGALISTSPKMYFVESSPDLHGSLYGVREHAMFADLDAEMTTWNWVLLTVFEKDLATGEIDSSQNHFLLSGFGYVIPQAYIDVDVDDCEAEVEFSSNSDEDGNDNVYIEIRKDGDVYFTKTFSTDYGEFEYEYEIGEPGSYKVKMFIWKMKEVARDTVKATFTVSCDDVAGGSETFRVSAAPEYVKGIHINYPEADGEISIFSSDGTVVYASHLTSETHVPIPISGVYIVSYYDTRSGITLNQKVIVQ